MPELCLTPRPQFPAQAPLAPLGPTAFAPLRLPAAFEFEWTPILSCNFLCLFSNYTASFLCGHIQGGDGYRGKNRLPLWGYGDRETAQLAPPGREYTRKSGYSRPRSSPAEFPLAGCLRQALRSRIWNSGREACAAFQSVQFFLGFYRFSRRG